MVNYEKQGKNYVKTTGQVFVTGQYINNLYHLNFQKGSDIQGEINFAKDEDRLELINFMKIYFQFSYYLCISPFQFTQGGEKGQGKDAIILQTWKPQKVACCIMYILCLLRILTEARLNTPDTLDNYTQNPAQYFLLIMNVFNFLYKLMFMMRLWRNKKEFLTVVNFILQEATLPIGKAKLIRKRYVIMLILTCYTGMAFLSLIAGKYFLTGITGWTSEWWYRRIVADTRYTFFYGNKVGANEAPEMSQVTVLDECLVVVNAFALVSRYLLGFYTDLCILTMVLTLWSVSYAFAKSIPTPSSSSLADIGAISSLGHNHQEHQHLLRTKSEKLTNLNPKWSQIYKSFKGIRLLAYLINNALGSIVCWFLGDAIMSYSVHMDALLVTRDVFKRANLFLYYFCTFGILFTAADICKQMETIKMWLAEDENRKSIPPDQIDIILHEMLAKDVGIRGSNIFTITYSTAATFVGTIVTYFIICVQQNTVNV